MRGAHITLVTEYVTGLNDMCSHTVCMDMRIIMMTTDASARLDKLRSDPQLIQIVLLSHRILLEYFEELGQS